MFDHILKTEHNNNFNEEFEKYVNSIREKLKDTFDRSPDKSIYDLIDKRFDEYLMKRRDD
tara:strand:+ start:197 stop:376 length:180 start_codon:yes stop_codon:yes gene_type:complete